MVTIFFEKYLNGEPDGFGQKQFDSKELAMTWIREQSTGTTGIHTLENVQIYESVSDYNIPTVQFDNTDVNYA
jgi:hypothetical protein